MLDNLSQKVQKSVSKKVARKPGSKKSIHVESDEFLLADIVNIRKKSDGSLTSKLLVVYEEDEQVVEEKADSDIDSDFMDEQYNTTI